MMIDVIKTFSNDGLSMEVKRTNLVVAATSRMCDSLAM